MNKKLSVSIPNWVRTETYFKKCPETISTEVDLIKIMYQIQIKQKFRNKKNGGIGNTGSSGLSEKESVFEKKVAFREERV